MPNLYNLPDELLVAAEGGLRIITLNRPNDLNASTSEMLFSFPRLFAALAEDPEARVAILTGAGRAFSAGGDMSHFVKTLDDADFARTVQENARRTIHSCIDLPIPIIAAVNGPAVGWGATLATLCDIVLMSEKAFLAEPHINIGLVVGDGISVSWPLYMSLLRAKELIFTGERINPQQAVEFGLAANGISGIETALGLLLTAVDAGRLPLARAIAALTVGPAAVLGSRSRRGRPGLNEGSPADLVVFDRADSWTVGASELRSRGRNTPLLGRTLPGRVLLTIADGRIAHEAPSD